jgi:prepilin-type N-terminal cleavage/methylation domain-containing protein
MIDRHKGGYTLIELVIVTALLALVVGAAVPGLLEWSSGRRLYMAAYEIRSVLHQAKGFAVYHATRVGVKFFTDGEWVSFAIYRDGDGDGVRTRDIESGVDPQLTPTRRMLNLGADVRFGFPPGRPPRDPGDPRRRLGNLQDPVRFNRSDLASFGPLGGSTPGSLYLTDGKRLRAVRVFGRTGKIKIISYDPMSESWE